MSDRNQLGHHLPATLVFPNSDAGIVYMRYYVQNSAEITYRTFTLNKEDALEFAMNISKVVQDLSK